MESFLKWYASIANGYGFSLSIYHSSIMDWCIDLGYKCTHREYNDGKAVISVQSVDIELAFSEFQVKLKKYMLEKYKGY
jgi:hypothetical protein